MSPGCRDYTQQKHDKKQKNWKSETKTTNNNNNQPQSTWEDTDEIIVQNFWEIHWQNSPQKLKVYIDTNKHGHREVIHIIYPEKNQKDLLKVKVNSGVESCILPLWTDRRMFSSNLTSDGLPTPDAFQSVTHIRLDSWIDGIFPVFITVILKVAL